MFFVNTVKLECCPSYHFKSYFFEINMYLLTTFIRKDFVIKFMYGI